MDDLATIAFAMVRSILMQISVEDPSILLWRGIVQYAYHWKLLGVQVVQYLL